MKRKGLLLCVIAILLASLLSITSYAAVKDGNRIYLKPNENGVDLELLVWSVDPFGNGLTYAADDPVVYDGDLPNGLSLELDRSGVFSDLQLGDSFRLTGDVSASPAQTSGSFTIKLTEYNNMVPPPDVQELEFHWTIHECEIAVYPSALPNATVGVPYSITLLPYKTDMSGPWCGSVGPNEVITYHAITGLPPGLSYDIATGTISGTPTTVGTYTFDAAISGETKNAANQVTLHQADGDAPLTIIVAANIPNPNPNPNPSRNDDDDDDDGGQQYVYYVIESEAGKGGSINPDGLTRVEEYGSQSYIIKTEDGYVIEKVLVDGKDIGIVKKYDFTRVTANHKIQVYFVKEKVEQAPSDTPENINYNSGTGAPPMGSGSAKGMVSLGAALLLLGGVRLLKGKS